jgi:hypothetical protein
MSPRSTISLRISPGWATILIADIGDDVIHMSIIKTTEPMSSHSTYHVNGVVLLSLFFQNKGPPRRSGPQSKLKLCVTLAKVIWVQNCNSAYSSNTTKVFYSHNPYPNNPYYIMDANMFLLVKFVRHGAVGARLIHASAHARLRRWGAFKLLPSALTCPLARSVAISIAEGSRALHIPY